jgi:hypothetical protein
MELWPRDKHDKGPSSNYQMLTNVGWNELLAHIDNNISNIQKQCVFTIPYVYESYEINQKNHNKYILQH